MVEGGADARFIQEKLGHADPKKTETYTRTERGPEAPAVHRDAEDGLTVRVTTDDNRGAFSKMGVPEPTPPVPPVPPSP